IILPLVGDRRPPSRCSSVDLPQPDGPIIATNSPSLISREIPRRAGTSSLPILYDFARSSAFTIVFIDLLESGDRRGTRSGCRRLRLRSFQSCDLTQALVEVEHFEIPTVF